MKPGSGRVLAIDPGEVRLGLALSDALGITAQPLDSLTCVGPRKDVEKIARLCRERDVSTVVVGLPLALSGGEGGSAVKARGLAERLRVRLGQASVEMWDERLTTVQAERSMIEAGVRRKRRRQVVDSIAAVLILQNYLDARSSTTGPA